LKTVHKDIQENYTKQLKIEKQRMAREYKGQINEHVRLFYLKILIRKINQRS